MNTYRTERGQAIVLIALALVGMLAFAGLAIDGGRMLSEHRRAQNIADASALAAALAAVDGLDPYEAAVNQAAFNDFIDFDWNVNPGESVDLIVNNPPSQGPYAGNSEYYEVIIRGHLEGGFSRLLMINELPVEAYAVTHAQGTASVSGTNAIHALNTEGNGIEFKGDISVNVDGGNIMSNSGIDKDGGSGDIHVTNGGIYYVTGDTDKWKGDVSPEPQKAPGPIYVAPVPEPDCGSTYQSAPRSDQGKHIYSPGIYSERVVINAHDDVIFEPGIYCFMNGLHDNGNSRMKGMGVTFVLKGGNLQFNGNSEVHLKRPNDLVDDSGNQWGGMLLYVPPSNADAVIDITGNNETTFSGTILAPEAYCRIGGTSKDLGVYANIICLDILFHGTPDVVVTFRAEENYRTAPAVELSQ